jgi:hypothetical protein
MSIHLLAFEVDDAVFPGTNLGLVGLFASVLADR